MPSNPLEKRQARQVSTSLPQPQKIAVIVLALLAILIFIFWIFQMRKQLTGPFDVGQDKIAKNNPVATTTDSRLQDTDGDGLSDYDEINVYYTSPYLEDSDSDGLTDSAEIKNETDPNCPQGQNCNALADNVAASSSTPSAGGDNATITAPEVNADGIDSKLLQTALNGQIDAASLRQILISSGVDKSILDQISDEDLMKSYQETLNSQSDTSSVQTQ